MKLVLFNIVFSLCLLTQIGIAKPVLNKLITGGIYPDSQDPNIYWAQIAEFNICGLDNGKPIFSINAFKLNETPRVFVSFDICARYDLSKISKYQEIIRKINPKGEIKIIEPYYNEIPKVLFPRQKDYKITTSCSHGNVKDSRFTCGAFALGEHRADTLYNFFRWTQGLISGQYLKYSIDGVEQDQSGSFKSLLKEFNAVVYVHGLSEYPQLFNTEWKP